jgi:hypothetical protein
MVELWQPTGGAVPRRILLVIGVQIKEQHSRKRGTSENQGEKGSTLSARGGTSRTMHVEYKHLHIKVTYMYI